MINFYLVLSIQVENFNLKKLNKKVIERVIDERLGLKEKYSEFKKGFKYSHDDNFFIRGIEIPTWIDWFKVLDDKDRKTVIDSILTSPTKIIHAVGHGFEERVRLKKSFLNCFLPELYEIDSMAYFQEAFTELEIKADLDDADREMLKHW